MFFDISITLGSTLLCCKLISRFIFEVIQV